MSDVRVANGVIRLVPGRADEIVSLGFMPQAIMWWSCPESEHGNGGGIGFLDRGSDGGAIAWASDDGVPHARTASWAQQGAIAGLSNAGEDTAALRAKLDFGDDGFAVRVLEGSAPWELHYVALGGDVRARARWFSAPSAPGRQRVEMGLSPDLLLFASAAPARDGAPERGLSISFGAASSHRWQGATAFASPDGSEPGAAAGAQRDDAAIVAVRDRSRLDALATVCSLDTEAIELDWRHVSPASRQVLCLVISGIRARVGAAYSPPEPGRAATWGIPFAPTALISFGWGLAASTEARDIGRLTLGAATQGGGTSAISWDDRDTWGESTATHMHRSTEEIVLVPDTQTGGLHAAAHLASFDPGGFSLRWSRSDGITRQLIYVAIGPPAHGRWDVLAAWWYSARTAAKSGLRRVVAGIRARLGRAVGRQ